MYTRAAMLYNAYMHGYGNMDITKLDLSIDIYMVVIKITLEYHSSWATLLYSVIDC